jgi:hypothetical protein
MRARVREPICGTVAVLAVLAAASIARADAPAPASMSGAWQAGATSMDVALESWGKDCGPQPQSTHSQGGGNVRIEVQNQALVIHGREHDVRSDQCWSPNPTLRRISTSYADGLWVTRCRTGSQDPREEVGTYTLKSLAADRLLYQDVSHFNWKLNESTCVATITTTQTLHKLSGKEAAAAEKAQPAPPMARGPAPPVVPMETQPEEPAPKTNCKPQAPARLSLRPKRADISLGQRVCFHARVVDAAGCPIEDAPLKWSLEHGPGIRASLQNGCFQAGESSAESEGTFRVIAKLGRRHAEAPVVVSVESLQALLAKRLEAGAITGEAEAAAQAQAQEQAAQPTPPATASTRVAARALPETEPDGRRWLAGLAAGLALLAAGLLLLRRSRPRARASTRKQPRTRRCPRCNATYPEDNVFCGEDGSELLPPQ